MQRARYGVGVGPIELDLDAERLVRIADHVLALVARRFSGHRQSLELPMQGFVGDERSLAFGDVLALQPEELVPELLRVLLLSLPLLALLTILRQRRRVELNPGWAIDRRVIVNQGTRRSGTEVSHRARRPGGRGPGRG